MKKLLHLTLSVFATLSTLFTFSTLSYAQTTTPPASTGSSITITQLSGQQVEDLAMLGKVWGFLKYYHPKVADGGLNWDEELFKVMPQVLSAKNKNERNAALYTWVKTLGEGKTVQVKDSAVVRYQPDFSWINPKTFGNELSQLLIKTTSFERKPDNHYVKLYSEDMPIPYFKNEAPYTQFKYPDAGYRLLSLYRYWNIVEYFYPYKNTLKENWNSTLKDLIPQFVTAKDEMAYKLAVANMVAKIQDSHVVLSIWTEPLMYEFQGKLKLAANVVFVGNKAVVSKSLADVSGDAKELLKGDEIISINQKSIETILKERLPYTAASNYPTQLSRIATNLLRTNDTVVNLKIKRAGVEKEISVKALPWAKAIVKENESEPSFKILSSDIAYIHPGKLAVKGLDSIMKTALKSKAIIIDMRTYPKETMFTMAIGNYLFGKASAFCKMTKGSVTKPGQFSYLSDSYMENLKIGKDTADYYKGKLIVLANESTQSFAEMTLMAFKAGPNTTIIGSQTAGADGNVTPPIILPGNIRTVFTGIGMYHLDGGETQRIGIVPDIEVKPTISGIKNGQDEVLESAIGFANKN